MNKIKQLRELICSIPIKFPMETVFCMALFFFSIYAVESTNENLSNLLSLIFFSLPAFTLLNHFRRTDRPITYSLAVMAVFVALQFVNNDM